MCYEERYLSEWARKAVRKREETRTAPEVGNGKRNPNAKFACR